MKNSECIIGNSSSGIIEAPLLGTKTINIGERQKGRLLSKTVFQTSSQTNKIKNILENILKKQKKQKKQKYECAYKGKNVAKKIIKVIEKTKFNKLIIKKFYDIKFKK